MLEKLVPRYWKVKQLKKEETGKEIGKEEGNEKAEDDDE